VTIGVIGSIPNERAPLERLGFVRNGVDEHAAYADRFGRLHHAQCAVAE
jgi:hypothetical protein